MWTQANTQAGMPAADTWLWVIGILLVAAAVAGAVWVVWKDNHNDAVSIAEEIREHLVEKGPPTDEQIKDWNRRLEHATTGGTEEPEQVAAAVELREALATSDTEHIRRAAIYLLDTRL